jgi:hypothetical protein
VALFEERIVYVRLAHIRDPDKVLYDIALQFDKRLPDGVQDIITITNTQD